jgi:hypothetical protein
VSARGDAAQTWERDLFAALALHDLAVAGYRLVPSEHRIEAARLGVVAAIDPAVAAGVPEATIDAALRRHADENAPRAASAETFPHHDESRPKEAAPEKLRRGHEGEQEA